MTDAERSALQSAILTICDARGNWQYDWQYGWQEIVKLAGMDPEAYRAPFRERSEEELRQLANTPFPNVPRTKQGQGSEGETEFNRKELKEHKERGRRAD